MVAMRALLSWFPHPLWKSTCTRPSIARRMRIRQRATLMPGRCRLGEDCTQVAHYLLLKEEGHNLRIVLVAPNLQDHMSFCCFKLEVGDETDH